jgi:creatinine amidohydrolase/Fe(II)-dependent formamide hydrolase-like protein
VIRLTLVLALVLWTAPLSAQTRSVFIEDLTTPELREAIAAGTTSALIFTGGIEQGGPHMALIKHNLLGRYIAAQIAQKLGNTLVYPIVPFSMAGEPIQKTGHMRLPGTISLSSEVYVGLIRQVALSAISAGFKNVFIMGDHGQGQGELKLAAESLNCEWRGKGARVFFVADMNGKANQEIDGYLSEHKLKPGGHAAIGETSQVMFLDDAHKYIRQDKLPISKAGPTSETGVGDPTGATAEMGRIFLDFKIDDAVAQMRQQLTAK